MSNQAISQPTSEMNNILRAAQEESTFSKLLKFRKGEYIAGGEVVPLGTECIAHCNGWTKAWVKFINRQLIERRLYRISQGEFPPQRDELDDNDPQQWPPGIDGNPADPWVYQYMIPLERVDNGDLYFFATSSTGGRRAIAELCAAYGRRMNTAPGLPVVRLDKAEMPTTHFGKVIRPAFVRVRWSETAPVDAPAALPPGDLARDLDDEIPF